jgi:hypothetical protein
MRLPWIARHVVTQRKQTIGDVLQPVHMTLSAADGNQRLAGVPQLLTDYLRKVSHLSREIEPQRITQENAK